MPIINGKYYMNPAYGRALERNRARDKARSAGPAARGTRNSGRFELLPALRALERPEPHHDGIDPEWERELERRQGVPRGPVPISENVAAAGRGQTQPRSGAGRDDAGGHWVTIDGRHVLVHDAQGKAQPREAPPSPKDKVPHEKSDGSEGGYSIEAQGGTMWLYDRNGNLVETFHYETGRNGDTNPAHKDTGPLPPGRYTLDPSKISEAGLFRHWIDPRDWGEYRVPLQPEPGTNTHGRSGFFLHGGSVRSGSEGCLKVNSANQDSLRPIKASKRPGSCDGVLSVFVKEG
jgi:Protein of unknown function (DUF2778)